MEHDKRVMSPGRIFLTEMVPGIFAVPEELHTLSPRDAIVRVNEFQAVTEKLKKLVLMSREDFQKEEGYNAVFRLRGLTGSESVMTMLEAFDKIKRDEKDPRNIRTPFDIMPDVKGTPQQTFSMTLVEGCAHYLGRLVGRNQQLVYSYRSSINEILRKDFPNSSLVKDLKLDSSNDNVLQPSILPRVNRMFERDDRVAFEEAFEEGRSEALNMLKYDTSEKLEELLNIPGIAEYRDRILDYDEKLGWDASVILSYIAASNMPYQKGFARIFLEEGKNAFNQLAAVEKEVERKKRRSEGVGDIIFEVLNVDSPNKKFWWMFAPYLLDELWINSVEKEIDFDLADALKRILLWAKTAGWTTDEVSLWGLEAFGRLNHSDFRLSANPQGASHRYIRQEARKIVNNLLLQRYELDPDKTFL